MPPRLRPLLGAGLLACSGAAMAETPGAAAAFAARCEAAAAGETVDVTTRAAGWHIDNSRSWRTLTQMKRPGLRGATRVRLIGGAVQALARATGGRPDLAVWSGPVTEAGRVELLPFLHEQAVSITAHRFGNPDKLAASVL